MDNAIIEIEKKCHEKLLVFHDLLGIFRKERKSIISADINALWKHTSEKQKKADLITGIRAEIIDIIHDYGIELDISPETFSLSGIISALPEKKRQGLINARVALTHVKNEIAAVSNENRIYLRESLSTIEDLLAIMTGNRSDEEIYSRQKGMTQCGNSRVMLYREA